MGVWSGIPHQQGRREPSPVVHGPLRSPQVAGWNETSEEENALWVPCLKCWELAGLGVYLEKGERSTECGALEIDSERLG